jgi:hypothetical protein
MRLSAATLNWFRQLELTCKLLDDEQTEQEYRKALTAATEAVEKAEAAIDREYALSRRAAKVFLKRQLTYAKLVRSHIAIELNRAIERNMST